MRGEGSEMTQHQRTYRPATRDDAHRLFCWRNDPLTRSMFRSSDLVEWDQHLRWLERRLDGAPNLFIFEWCGVPVGTFRLDDDEISYTIAPEHRERGLATAMLKMVRRDFGPLRAMIFPRNVASIRAAQSASLTVILLDD